MKDQEKLGIAWVWVKRVDTGFQRGATGSKQALIMLSLLEEIKLEAWLLAYVKVCTLGKV